MQRDLEVLRPMRRPLTGAWIETSPLAFALR